MVLKSPYHHYKLKSPKWKQQRLPSLLNNHLILLFQLAINLSLIPSSINIKICWHRLKVLLFQVHTCSELCQLLNTRSTKHGWRILAYQSLQSQPTNSYLAAPSFKFQQQNTLLTKKLSDLNSFMFLLQITKNTWLPQLMDQHLWWFEDIHINIQFDKLISNF